MSTALETQYKLPAPMRKQWDLYMLLAGHELLGLAPSEIAKGLDVAPSWVSTTLPALAAETGSVERIDGTNRWRLGVPFVRVCTTVTTNVAASRRKIDEIAQRYSVPL